LPVACRLVVIAAARCAECPDREDGDALPLIDFEHVSLRPQRSGRDLTETRNELTRSALSYPQQYLPTQVVSRPVLDESDCG
jgi:hypothetical protein